jgi:MYXO-CTERM domain-containing protein
MRFLAVTSMLATGLLFFPSPARAGTVVASSHPAQPAGFIAAARETLVDSGSGNKGSIGVGDVVYGFFVFRMYQWKLDSHGKLRPPVPNTVYAVFSQQVTGVTDVVGFDKMHNLVHQYALSFGATTTPGYTLSALTGQAMSPKTMFAFYDRFNPYPAGQGDYKGDLTHFPVPGGGLTENYLHFIAGHGTLEMTAGRKDPRDFFVVQTPRMKANKDFVANSALLTTFPRSQPLGSFSAGLSILDNHTGAGYASVAGGWNPMTSAAGAQRFWIKNGDVHGNADARNAEEFGTALGARAEFLFAPATTPEPSSLVLAGLGVAGLAGAAFWRRRKRGVAA